MRRTERRRRSRRGDSRSRTTVIMIGIFAVGAAAAATAVFYSRRDTLLSPEELLVQYMEYIPEKEYEQMYTMLNTEASGNISQEDFIQRNSAIYEGIEMQNMEVEVTAYDKERGTVAYEMSFDTTAGRIQFENEAFFMKGEEGYQLV